MIRKDLLIHKTRAWLNELLAPMLHQFTVLSHCCICSGQSFFGKISLSS